MFQLTPTQRETLNKMPRFRVLAYLHTGAAIVVGNGNYHNAQVLDVDGHVFAISRYLAILDRRI